MKSDTFPAEDLADAPMADGSLHIDALSRGAQAISFLYIVAAAAYLGWRPATFNDDAIFFSCLVYGAEVFGFVLTILHLVMTWRLTQREPPAPQFGHAVDVFIATINEPVEMVRRTALAALRMDYPHVTWLLDDGRRTEMRALAEELGCRYLARPDNRNAKAGNLNHALQHTQGQFVAFFDADHAPRRDFLMRTLGYFRDSQVGFVQTPQDFFNLDSYEHRHAPARNRVWMEQSFFWRVIQRGKDCWNAAFFCGSCAVMRRTALDSVGGIATGSITEDLQTSLRLHKKGWRSIYHAEPLAFGVAPASVQQYLKQRLRWAQGAMQVWRKEGILFTRGLTTGQRVCYIATIGAYLEGWQKAIFYVAPAIVLFTGIMPIADFGAEFFLRFLPYYLLTFLLFEEMGRGFGRSLLIEQYNMARFGVFLLASFGFFRDKLRFSVTDKALAAAGRHSLLPLLPQVFVLGLNAFAIPVGLILQHSGQSLPDDALAINIVWALINSGLAAVLLRFNNNRQQFRRRDYRFPVPLPARIVPQAGPPIFGTLDDISGDGFSFYGRVTETVRRGDVLNIDIFLPTTILSAHAAVRSLKRAGQEGNRYVKAIGCSFEWRDRDQQDQLTVFLYASDAQWKINRFDERIFTPLQHLTRWLHAEQPRLEQPRRWAPAIIQAEGSLARYGPVMGIVSIGVPERQVITLKPVPAGAPLQLRVFTRRGASLIEGTAELHDRIATPTQPLHHYKLRRKQPQTKGK